MNAKSSEWSSLVGSCMDVPFSQRPSWVKDRLPPEGMSVQSILTFDNKELFVDEQFFTGNPIYGKLLRMLKLHDDIPNQVKVQTHETQTHQPSMIETQSHQPSMIETQTHDSQTQQPIGTQPSRAQPTDPTLTYEYRTATPFLR